MQAFRALKRPIPVLAGAIALTFAPFAGSGTPAAGADTPPAAGTIGNVITTTCGNSPIMVLSVVVCQLVSPTSSPAATGPRAVRRGAPLRQPASARLAEAQAIGDVSGSDWRRAGVVIHVAFHPQACCHWGIFDPRDNSIWIGPTAYANPTRLRYTVLHELGHAWQWHSGHLDRLSADMAPWGQRGFMAGLEAWADCVSVLWGASPAAGHYWACPPGAANLVARRLAGDWRS
jgi:hypothetical protein